MSIVSASPLPVPPPSALFSVPRPFGRDLSAAELEQFVCELADRPELWIDSVRHDADQRVYEELLSDEHVTAWLRARAVQTSGCC